jgi:adenine phosphoribosyltransferase
MDNAKLKEFIRVVPDFPKKGISFKDITTIFKDAEALKYVVDTMAERYRDERIDMVVGTEARGFLVGTPLAYLLGAGFSLVRKANKLPADTVQAKYSLEYGTDVLEIHKDAICPGQRVLIVDDLLATGGTMKATADLVKQLEGDILGFAFIIELTDLGGRKTLKGYDIFSLVTFDH